MTRLLIKEKESSKNSASTLKNFMNIQRVFKDSQSQINFSLYHPKYFPVYYHPHNHINHQHYCRPSYHQKQHSLNKGLDHAEKIKREKRLLNQPPSLLTNLSNIQNLSNHLQKWLKPQMLIQTRCLYPRPWWPHKPIRSSQMMMIKVSKPLWKLLVKKNMLTSQGSWWLHP